MFASQLYIHMSIHNDMLSEKVIYLKYVDLKKK